MKTAFRIFDPFHDSYFVALEAETLEPVWTKHTDDAKWFADWDHAVRTARALSPTARVEEVSR